MLVTWPGLADRDVCTGQLLGVSDPCGLPFNHCTIYLEALLMSVHNTAHQQLPPHHKNAGLVREASVFCLVAFHSETNVGND